MVEIDSHNFFSGYNYIELMQTPNKLKIYTIKDDNIKLNINNNFRQLSNEEKPFIYAIYAIVLNYQSNKYDDYDFQIIPPSEDFSAEYAAKAANKAAAFAAFSAAYHAAKAAKNAAVNAAFDAAFDASKAAENALNSTPFSASKAAFTALSDAIEQANTAAKQAKNSNDNNDYARAAVNALYHGLLCIDLMNQLKNHNDLK
jgi:hypothetical protein